MISSIVTIYMSSLDHITENLKHDKLVRMVFIMLLLLVMGMMTEMMTGMLTEMMTGMMMMLMLLMIGKILGRRMLLIMLSHRNRMMQ